MSFDLTIQKLNSISYEYTGYWKDIEESKENSSTEDTDADSVYNILDPDEVMNYYEDSKNNGGKADYNLASQDEKNQKVEMGGNFSRQETETKITSLLKDLNNYKIDGEKLSSIITTDMFDKLNDVQLNDLVLALIDLKDAKEDGSETKMTACENKLNNFSNYAVIYDNTVNFLTTEIKACKDSATQKELISIRDQFVRKKIGTYDLVKKVNALDIDTSAIDSSNYNTGNINNAYKTINEQLKSSSCDSVEIKTTVSALTPQELKIVISKIGLNNFVSKISSRITGDELSNTLNIIYLKLLEGEHNEDLQEIVENNYSSGSYQGYSAQEIGRVVKKVQEQISEIDEDAQVINVSQNVSYNFSGITSDVKLQKIALVAIGYKQLNSNTLDLGLSDSQLKNNIKILASF